MAIVRPFRGLRPVPEMARQVASPPYDVLSADEARTLAASNPNSFLRVNKAELEFEPSVSPYSEKVYERGKQNLARLVREGIMVRDEQKSFYLYRLTWQGRSQTGLVALTSVAEYNAGKIKKHEHTRPEKVNDRANHIEFLEAQVGPVFSTFRHRESISEVFNGITASSPTTDFEADDGVRHELWVVSEPARVDELVKAFAELDCLYIADGHHRSQAAAEVCRRLTDKNPDHSGDEIYNFFLNVLFADDELRILPYNRVVNDLNSLTHAEAVERAAGTFDVSEQSVPVEPEKVHQFGLYGDGQWHLLAAKDGSFDSSHPTKSIDASVLADNFLDPILGISDPRKDKRIDFVGGIRGVQELVRLVDSGEFKMAFSLYPTSIKQLLAVADAGEVMPPKSTWFEPKLRSGMVVNLLTE
ncbi:MAG: DUF1015 domain-containing protein [Candidatus Zixiibacteriota bacterium]|nr:MAG: DUF1015 domain-containing protein [candidate division Zixibacteria bacterium]